MKAVVFRAFGTPHEVVECADVEDPGEPGPGEVLVDVEAFPVNPVDLLTMEGRYAVRPALPARVGSEAAGRVVAVGLEVTGLRPGQRVIPLGRDNWAERLRVPAAELLPMPEAADGTQLAMLKINPATALLMLRGFVALERGEWVVQDAANSAVGRHVVALARANGLRTANVVRREEARETLRSAGAEAVLTDGPDLAERIRAATGGAPIRLGLDAVAGDICARLADALAEGGTLVNYGLLSGRACEIRPDQTVFRGITLTGFWLARELRGMPPERLRALYDELAQRVVDGTLRSEVEATYPMRDIKAALAHAARPGRAGKVVVVPSG